MLGLVCTWLFCCVWLGVLTAAAKPLWRWFVAVPHVGLCISAAGSGRSVARPDRLVHFVHLTRKWRRACRSSLVFPQNPLKHPSPRVQAEKGLEKFKEMEEERKEKLKRLGPTNKGKDANSGKN